MYSQWKMYHVEMGQIIKKFGNNMFLRALKTAE